ncbi:MAG: uncharacterized protein FD130_2301, partial [Halothiobacillaceae bacterium]
EAGLEPLLDQLLADANQVPRVLASGYVDAEKGFADVESVLDGARQIFMERVAEEADLVGRLRDYLWSNGWMASTVAEGMAESGAKFADYFDYQERLAQIPSHRALALFRGRTESILRVKVRVDGQDDLAAPHLLGGCDLLIADHYGIAQRQRPADSWLLESVRWAWRIKVAMQLETEVMLKIREQAELEAIRVFGDNLRDLLFGFRSRAAYRC